MPDTTQTWLQEIREYWSNYVSDYERRTATEQPNQRRRDARLTTPGKTRPAVRQSA